jgi:hypothetical protein
MPEDGIRQIPAHKIKKAHLAMRLKLNPVRSGRFNSLLNPRLLSILGINTVCYASPTLNSVFKA